MWFDTSVYHNRKSRSWNACLYILYIVCVLRGGVIKPVPVLCALSLGNSCPYTSDDLNEDTISVLVRLITEKKGGCWVAVMSCKCELVVRASSSPVALEGGAVRQRHVCPFSKPRLRTAQLHPRKSLLGIGDITIVWFDLFTANTVRQLKEMFRTSEWGNSEQMNPIAYLERNSSQQEEVSIKTKDSVVNIMDWASSECLSPFRKCCCTGGAVAGVREQADGHEQRLVYQVWDHTHIQTRTNQHVLFAVSCCWRWM